ncbi:LysE family translocator [Bacterioplanes sanyensis]|uniref:LysE family translocator n=1 Tax=Bacterioplanes sanyensis TaxID=1249553 RepID=UPI0027E5444C|nr:LysE family transporter [Bacterioplanes sanyensis]
MPRQLYWLHVKPPPSDSAEIHAASFRESVTVEVLNPKSSLFYLAFIPQFLPTSSEHPVAMLFLIGTLANVIMSLTDAVIVVGASRLQRQLAPTSSQRAMGEYGVSAVFLALAAGVILS